MFVTVFVGCQSTSVRSAKIYMQQNDPVNAKKVLLEGAAINPADAELWYILGKVNVELEEYVEMNEAFANCQELTDQFDEDIKNTRYEAWRVTYNAAVTPFNEKRFEDTIAMLEIALQIQPGDAETLKRMGLCYLQLDQYEEAEKFLTEGLAAMDTPDIASRYNLLIIYWKAEKYTESIDLIESILADHADEIDASRKVDVLQKKAFAYQQLDRKDDAIAVWDEAIQEMPDNPDFYYNKAILMHSMERYDDAAIAYMKSIELNPDDVEARMNAARSLLASEKWDEIVQVLEPYLFPSGTVEVYETEILETDPWAILSAAYSSLELDDKSVVVARILGQIREKAESGS